MSVMSDEATHIWKLERNLECMRAVDDEWRRHDQHHRGHRERNHDEPHHHRPQHDNEELSS